MTTPADYPAQLEAWKAKRLHNLKAPNGWLNIIGRTWLEAGTVTVGSDPDSDIVLSAGPKRLGTLTQAENGEVDFIPADGSPAHHLVPNKKHPPHFLLQGLHVEVTTINGVNALRVRDTNSKASDELEPLRYFATDPSWRIEAKWVPYEAPRGLTINTTKDIETEVEVTHKAVFERDGTTYELIATHGTPESPQFVIRDLTSRDDTYPASRFLFGENVTTDSIVLDFNKAINPPCAFTEYAVCPLPPTENVMPIRIEAGEKRLSVLH
jgi:uncharacterized protein (DUF1684 family)